MKTKLLNTNLQISNIRKNIMFFLIIAILLFLNEINLINKLFLSNNTMLGNVDTLKKYKVGIISIIYIFQFFATFITIVLETFIICIITKVLYKKSNSLKIFLEPIIISNIMCLIVNSILLQLLGTFESMEALKMRAVFSPANLLQPIIICYFLSKKNIIPKTIIDWVKTGGIYVAVIYIPAIVLLVFT